MTEKQLVGMNDKEDVNATALAAEISDLCHTSIQGADKTPAGFVDRSEFNKESVAQVLPLIAEDPPTHILEKTKKPRKPRQKKKKNSSNTTDEALQMQPANNNKVSSSAVKEPQDQFIPEPSKSELNPSDNIKPLALSAEQGFPEAIIGTPTTTLTETQLDGMNEKEDVNATALSAEVSGISHTSIQRAEKTPNGFVDRLEFNEESMAQVLPLIAEDPPIHILEKPKKPRKPRQKKNKHSSNTINEVLKMQPANAKKVSSSAVKEPQVQFMQEPSKSELNPPDNIKPLPLSAEQGFPEAIIGTATITITETQLGGMNEKEDINANALSAEVSDISHTSIQGAEKTPTGFVDRLEFNEESMAQVLPLIAEDPPTHILEKPKKPRNPRQKKKKNSSNTTDEALQMQPANYNKVSSSAIKEPQDQFIPEPSESELNPPDNIKPLPLSAEQGFPEAIIGTPTTTLTETQLGGMNEKEDVNATALSAEVSGISHTSIQGAEETPTGFVDRSEFNEESVAQVMPLIAEDTSTHILEKPKKPRKPRQKKNKHSSNTTDEALQMQLANANKVSSSAVKEPQDQFIPEPSESELNPPDNIKPLPLSAEQGFPEAIIGTPTTTLTETQLGGMNEKEDVNATALSAEVSGISHTSIQRAEKTPNGFVDRSEFNEESVAQVMPLIAEDAPTHILEKPKKPRKPRQKKNKNSSNTTDEALQMQPANAKKVSPSAVKEPQVQFRQEPSKRELNLPDNIKPLPLSAEQGFPEAIIGKATITITEMQLGGMNEKEDVNATALSAEVFDISHTSIQGAEKTPTGFVDRLEFNEESMAQVLPLIAEDPPTHILEKPKKPRKPRQKKNKNSSNITDQTLQMQPADTNKVSSSADKEPQAQFIQGPSKCEINPSDNIKPLALSAEQGFPAISNQDPMKQVVPVIAEEMLTNIPGKPKRTIKPKPKKNENNTHNNTFQQILQIQPANINKASSSTHDKRQVHFIPEPCTSKMNPPKNIKHGVPDAISDHDPKTQVLPVISEEMSTNILGKSKNPRKPQCKKIDSNTTEQALQMQPANTNKASSSDVEKKLVYFMQEISKSITFRSKIMKTLHRSAKRRVLDTLTYQQLMPVIKEETLEDIIEKPKKQRKSCQKKNKNNSSTVNQALQMLPAHIKGASSSAKEIQLYQIQEPCTTNVQNPKFVETQDAKAIDYGTNEMNQKSEAGQQTKNVLVAVESKQHGPENDVVNNNITETKTVKMVLPIKNMAEEDEKPQTSQEAMQETDEKAKGGAQTPENINYFPNKAVGNNVDVPQTSKDKLKESEENKAEGKADAQVHRHLLFFREFYDHNGRLSVRNFNEGKFYIDGLYSQMKLACLDNTIKDKIEEAIHSIMNDIIIDFKDFRVPIQKLEILFNRMHNIIFMRLNRIGLSDLASIEICKIVAIYRSHFKRAGDIQFLYSLMSSEDLKNIFY